MGCGNTIDRAVQEEGEQETTDDLAKKSKSCRVWVTESCKAAITVFTLSLHRRNGPSR